MHVLFSPSSLALAQQRASKVLNFCANNYLGLSNDKGVIEAAQKALQTHGNGLSSVRFICGTQVCVTLLRE